MANDKFTNITAPADQPGCDRLGCSILIPKGSTVRQSITGKVFHALDECNGLTDKDLAFIGRRVVENGTIDPSDALIECITAGLRKPVGTKAAKVNPAEDAEYAEFLAFKAAKAAANAGNLGKVTSNGKRTTK